jgi:hypothetical protein
MQPYNSVEPSWVSVVDGALRTLRVAHCHDGRYERAFQGLESFRGLGGP